METYSRPFAHVVLDDLIEHPLLERALRVVPPPESEAWHARYDNWAERKRATELVEGPLREVAERVADPSFVQSLCDALGIPDTLVADPERYGAGIHAHDPGGFLLPHLDYARHPRRDAERRLNVIVFLNETWQPEHGGRLELWDDMAERVVAHVEPRPGRCVAWEPSDVSYHSVERVNVVPRITLASYFLSAPARPTALRKRALFVPPRHSPIGGAAR